MLLVVVIFIVYGYYYRENKKAEESAERKSLSEGLYSDPADMPLVCIKNNCFSVEIADDPSEREIGLMERDSLDEESGMLFVFEQEGVYKFWMKNTLIPLDMIWIDGNNKIVFIKENAEPCKTDMCETFGPNGKAKCVLEINGGLAEKMKLKIGDAAEFK